MRRSVQLQFPLMLLSIAWLAATAVVERLRRGNNLTGRG